MPEAPALAVQAQLLSLSRSSLYYQPRAVSDFEVRVKHRLDELYTQHPFLGSRKLRVILAQDNLLVGRHRVRHYRQQMGLCTLYAKPKGSKPGEGHVIYPYLLRGLVIDRPDHVWGVDITYIRLVHGWVYLVAFLDWYSRYVVAWELSKTLDIAFVLRCRDAALSLAQPQIINSDQGGHFTSERFTLPVREAKVQISMDGRGRCMDNIFTERLWRTVKYEEVYLNEYASHEQAHQELLVYLNYYNHKRPHQALQYRTPAEVYRPGPGRELVVGKR